MDTSIKLTRLEDIVSDVFVRGYDEAAGIANTRLTTQEAVNSIKTLMRELVGDMEQRETEDMSLKSWTSEDYKAFGRNDLRSQLLKKIEAL